MKKTYDYLEYLRYFKRIQVRSIPTMWTLHVTMRQFCMRKNSCTDTLITVITKRSYSTVVTLLVLINLCDTDNRKATNEVRNHGRREGRGPAL